MFTHGRPPAAPFETGPIPLWSECFLVVSCPDLHVIEPESQWTGLISSGIDPDLLRFRANDIVHCPRCNAQIRTIRRLPLSLQRKSNQWIPPRHPEISELPAGNYVTPFSDASRPSPSTESTGISPPTRYNRPESTPIPTHTPRDLSPSRSQSSPPIQVDPTITSYSNRYISRPTARPISPRGPSGPPFNEAASQTAQKSPRSSFLSRWRRNRRGSDTAPSVMSRESNGDKSLPRYLSFCFSSDGSSLLLWETNSLVIVRLDVASNDGRPFDLGPLLRRDGTQGGPGSILFVAEGRGKMAAIASQGLAGKFLVVLDQSGLPEMSAVLPIGDATPKCLAMSRCNSFVAIGLESRAMLVRLTGGVVNFEWVITMSVRGPDSFEGIRVASQVCNITADGAYAIVATQMRDTHQSSEDGAIHTAVWTCEREAKGPFQLPRCTMPNDDQGLTSVQFHYGLQAASITGLTSTRYPLFLSLDKQYPVTIPSQVTDFRIRCSCVPPPPRDHLVYFLDASNRIYEADLHHRRVELVADINTHRGSLRSQDEPSAMAIGAGGVIEVFWRQGPGLWYLQVRLGEGVVSKENLRRRWDETVF